MNTVRSILVLLLLVLPATSYGQDKPQKTFLSALKEGQVVSVKEVAGKYELTVMKNAPVGARSSKSAPITSSLKTLPV